MSIHLVFIEMAAKAASTAAFRTTITLDEKGFLVSSKGWPLDPERKELTSNYIIGYKEFYQASVNTLHRAVELNNERLGKALSSINDAFVQKRKESLQPITKED